MWQELGIARTKDAKAIRRAYAARLRAIDPDADPAAFQRLRNAYDNALAYSAVPQRKPRPATATVPPEAQPETVAVVDAPAGDDDDEDDYDDSWDEDDAKPQREPPPPREPTEEERDSARLYAEISDAVQAGDSRKAMGLLTSALARGYIGIHARDSALAQIMPAVIADKTLSASEYLEMLRISGWGARTRRYDWEPPVRRSALARGEAEAWYVNLQRIAARRNWAWSEAGQSAWFARIFEGRAARMLLQGGQFMRLTKTGAEPLQRLLDQYRHHAVWLETRVDPRLARRAEMIVKVEKGLRTVRTILLIVLGGLFALGIAVAGAVSFNPIGLVGAFFIGRRVINAMNRLDKNSGS
jgi:hypothetical protein